MKPHALIPLFSADQIHNRINSLAEQIALDFTGKELIIIGLLNGCFIFLSDIVRALYGYQINMKIDFITVSSYYSSTESSGTLKISKDLRIDVNEKHVLLIDDILDTGRTLDFALNRIKEKNPSAVKTCVLLDKPSRRVVPQKVDYTGFEVSDTFVVGYGLDYAGMYREIPQICRIEWK